MRCAHHIISDQFYMPWIHTDIVRLEHALNFLEDDATCHLHPVRAQKRIDVVGLDVVDVDDVSRDVPDAEKVGTFRHHGFLEQRADMSMTG